MSELERNEVKRKIAALEAEKANTKGTKCEVYSRVTGFIRPVSNYNPGKKAEYGMRKMMSFQKCNCHK